MDRKNRAVTIRELAGFGLLLLLLLAGLLSSWYMGRQHTQMAKELEDSAWFALSGQWQQARDTAEQARNQWEQGWQIRAAFSDHTPMEEIDALFAQLSVYGAAEEQTDFSESCMALAQHVKAMGEAHRLSWWNVL